MNGYGISYRVTWCETAADGTRTRKKADYRMFSKYTMYGKEQTILTSDESRTAAQMRAADLRTMGYAACVEPIN